MPWSVTVAAGGEEAHDAVGDAELALAGQAADAEDLALADGEADTSRTVSPGMSTQRCSTERISSPNSRFSLGRAGSAATLRPTIQEAMSRTVTPGDRRVLDGEAVAQHHDAVGHVDDLVEAVGDEDDGDALGGQVAEGGRGGPRPRISVSTAVGSSRTRIRVFSRLISRAISVNCLWPTGISETSMSGSSLTPSLAMAASARLLHGGPVEDAHPVAEDVVQERRPSWTRG